MSIIFLACSGQCTEISHSAFSAIAADAALTFAGAETSKKYLQNVLYQSHIFTSTCYDYFR